MYLALAAVLGSTVLIALLLVVWGKLSRAVAGKVAAWYFSALPDGVNRRGGF